MKNLLIELFVEELPPKALKHLDIAFSEELFNSLMKQGLVERSEIVNVNRYATPRRLAVLIPNVLSNGEDKLLSQKLMPISVGLDASGNATPALIKRLQGMGLTEAAVANLTKQMDGKNEALFLDVMQKGVSLKDGLQVALNDAITKLPIPKVMTYQLADGWSSVNFVRPAHSLVALHGSDVVAVTALGLTASNQTQGHRFEAAVSPVILKNADTYAEQLKTEGAVIASFAERRAEIVRQLNAAAQNASTGLSTGLKPIEDEALLDEVTALVERPNVLLGQFEEIYLEVPQECLILTMKANQKYFPLLDASGKLTNKFLIVSNISPADPSAVIGGNERVVRPRLADAKFFFDQDRKKSLESRINSLDKVVYHNKLGTQGQRTERVSAIAIAIALQIGGTDLAAKAGLAAQLAKTDLVTDMVGEFPELQGIMGRYYAQHEGLDNEVAFAIEDHYKPRFAGDELPRNLVGVCVALADKLETLVGMFGIGNIPTGDKDPFALRRHALGITRLLSEKNLNINVESLIKTVIEQFPYGLLQLESQEGKVVVIPLFSKVAFFLNDRAMGYLKDLGYSTQEADAVISMSSPSEYVARLQAIRKARSAFSIDFDLLANADKRARNIINKSGMPSEVLVANLDSCIESAEKILLTKTRELRNEINELANKGDFETAMLRSLEISKPVTEFFDSVMVNAEDETIRLNRFRLLHEVTGLTNRVADLSKLAS